MFSIALGFFVLTYYLKSYGESSVAAFGVGTRIEQIALLPAIGLSGALMAIVGQNNGAHKRGRVQETVKLCIWYGLILITVMSILIYVFAESLVKLFTDDREVIEIGIEYIQIMALIQWAYVMSFLHIGFLQAIKKPAYAFYEAIVRKIITPLIAFYLVVTVCCNKG